MMKLRFLCGPHRLEISNHPKKAICCWHNSTDTAQNLCDQNRYKEALPFLGSAFETAEIIMTTRATDIQKAGELFTTSAVQFAGACARLDYTSQCLEIYRMVINRLERELTLGSRYQTMKASAVSGSRRSSGEPYSDTSGQVQLELSSATLRHMLIDNRLAGEELHCLNPASKKVIKRILLDKLALFVGQNYSVHRN